MSRHQVLRFVEPLAFILVVCGAALVLSRFRCHHGHVALREPLVSGKGCMHPDEPRERCHAVHSCRLGSDDDCDRLSLVYASPDGQPSGEH